jgi:hypothetical protein
LNQSEKLIQTRKKNRKIKIKMSNYPMNLTELSEESLFSDLCFLKELNLEDNIQNETHFDLNHQHHYEKREIKYGNKQKTDVLTKNFLNEYSFLPSFVLHF